MDCRDAPTDVSGVSRDLSLRAAGSKAQPPRSAVVFYDNPVFCPRYASRSWKAFVYCCIARYVVSRRGDLAATITGTHKFLSGDRARELTICHHDHTRNRGNSGTSFSGLHPRNAKFRAAET